MSAGLQRPWLAGFVVGITAGFAALEIPPVGWGLVVAFAAAALRSRARGPATGGLLTGLGGVWVVLLERVAVSCRASDGELGCQAPDLHPWLTVGLAMLVVGAVLSLVALWHGSR
jgi:hypothetical protein